MESVVLIHPEIMHGTPCFKGTRVAVNTLFDHLDLGYSIDGFLEQFPSVKREQVMALLHQLREHAQKAPLAITA